LSLRPLFAVIPARGGSKGLPGKNIRPLAGLPLIAHSIRLAGLCPEIDHCIVSTDSEEIAAVARAHGALVPFIRPAELGRDDTPMWAVLQHALREMECRLGITFGSLLLLDPTSPGRIPQDIVQATKILELDPAAAGVLAVSEPHFNPRWVCVEEAGGYMKQLVTTTRAYVRRQDVPPVYRINALLYLWKRDYVVNEKALRLYDDPHRMLVVPEERAIHIDEPQDFALADLLVREGIIRLPWLPSVQESGR
jgi:CMP-N,N'-diacetyllegionaminic acid synthase